LLRFIDAVGEGNCLWLIQTLCLIEELDKRNSDTSDGFGLNAVIPLYIRHPGQLQLQKFNKPTLKIEECFKDRHDKWRI